MHSVIRGSRFCEQDCVSSSIGALAMRPRSNRNHLPVSVTCACRSQVDVIVTVPNNLVLMSTANAIEKRSPPAITLQSALSSHESAPTSRHFPANGQPTYSLQMGTPLPPRSIQADPEPLRWYGVVVNTLQVEQ
jgi:hypothetical protein